MKKWLWINGIAFGALMLHFLFTMVYSLPELIVPPALRQWSYEYSVPMFHQNWKLFAPDVPAYDVQLEMRTFLNGNAGEWHDGNITGEKNIEYIEQNICTGLGWQVANNLYTVNSRRVFDSIVKSREYQQAMYFLLKLHEARDENFQVDSVQARLHFRFTPPPDQALTWQESYLEFPAFNIQIRKR
jgi:hypothetical protein